jgi:WD40 repeat protein
VAFSADGQLLASASDDNTLALWDARTGHELRTLSGHTSTVSGVAFARAGRVLASASHDGTVKLWDAQTGQELHTLRGNTGPLQTVAFAGDGQVLASGGAGGTLKLWDARTGKELRTLSRQEILVPSVAFGGDGQVLASASGDTTVKLWDARTGQELRTLRGHTGGVKSVAFAADGQVLASASWDNTVKLWDARTGQELRTLRGHMDIVTSVAFSVDGQLLASASYDKTIKVWDARTGQELRTLRGDASYVASVAFSPDGELLASAGGDMTVKLWDVRPGQELRTLRGHTNAITQSRVAFSSDGKGLWSLDAGNNKALGWEAATGERLPDAGVPVLAWTGTAAWSPDGSVFALARYSGLVLLIPTGIPDGEQRFRLWVTAPDLHLHRDLAEAAANDKQPFALAFRLGRYLAAKNNYATGPNEAATLAGWLGTTAQSPGLLAALPFAVKTPFREPTFPDGITCTGILYKDSGIAAGRLLLGTARALEGDPSSWLNHAFHGGALLRNGEHAKALAALSRAVDLHGKPSPLTHYFLALVHVEMGQKDKARAYLEQAQPAKDAPWEDVYLHRLLRPEVEAALAKAER